MSNKLLAALSPIATEYYTSLASEVDLVAEGGGNKPAAMIWANSAATVYLTDVRGTKAIPLGAGYSSGIMGPWEKVGVGTAATVTSSSADTTPTFAGGETVTLRFDEGTIYDTGDVVVTFASTDTTETLVAARINAALQAAVLVAEGKATSHAFVTINTNEYVLTGRAHGTSAAVEVVAFSAAGVGTTLGLSVGVTNGTATGAPTGLGVQW
jgi:hypothetical protein